MVRGEAGKGQSIRSEMDSSAGVHGPLGVHLILSSSSPV